MSSFAQEHQKLILDGTKIGWHLERVKAWERGERIAPITIDMALTRTCNYSCGFCYAIVLGVVEHSTMTAMWNVVGDGRTNLSQNMKFPPVSESYKAYK